jgi:hypothetical protein
MQPQQSAFGVARDHLAADGGQQRGGLVELLPALKGFAIIRPSTGEYLKECGGWTKDVAGAVFLKDFEEVSKRWVGWNRAVVVVRRSYFLEFSGHQFGPCRTRVMAEAHAVKLHTPDVEITTRITHP